MDSQTFARFLTIFYHNCYFVENIYYNSVYAIGTNQSCNKGYFLINAFTQVDKQASLKTKTNPTSGNKIFANPILLEV